LDDKPVPVRNTSANKRFYNKYEVFSPVQEGIRLLYPIPV